MHNAQCMQLSIAQAPHERLLSACNNASYSPQRASLKSISQEHLSRASVSPPRPRLPPADTIGCAATSSYAAELAAANIGGLIVRRFFALGPLFIDNDAGLHSKLSKVLERARHDENQPREGRASLQGQPTAWTFPCCGVSSSEEC
jgi:hypothetical protein